MSEQIRRIFNAIMNEPTWNELDSYRAQTDMRMRCANAAMQVTGEELRRLTARIAELEAENARYRSAIDASIAMSQRGVSAVRVVAELERQLAPVDVASHVRQISGAMLQPTYSGNDLYA